ncbi:MAG: carbohydrate kinase [Chitinophagaceae bacterium]|nr:carbohydrate kinase [Chitinophagaceae bacterium]
MLLLGIDIGTSSIKVSVVDAATHNVLASASHPETEAPILAIQPGWAEQNPEQWWKDLRNALIKCHASKKYNPIDIAAIGIAYQMHGLVCVDKHQQLLRNAIIWCDSRAVEIGNNAFHEIGEEKCLSQLLNSPGNFTASKLAWVKQNEPAVYEQIDKVMLPGDYIGLKLTGAIATTNTGLSEGILWDFETNQLSKTITDYFSFDESLFPNVHEVFSTHGILSLEAANELALKPGIPITYKAGDQPNNALSLNVLQSGEVAATAGTSGVIYGVSDVLKYDIHSRINSFAHVNHTHAQTRIGILLCINGAGIFNKWIKNITGSHQSYAALNEMAATVQPGSDGLIALPFGNGEERMLNNKITGAQFSNLDFNRHTTAHLLRAVQEGIVFAFRYGLDIMKENGVNTTVIRAGNANLFLSNLFTQAFADATNVSVELHNVDGSVGAAIGAGIGAGYYKNAADAFAQQQPLTVVEPKNHSLYNQLYANWKTQLEQQLESFIN